jgi:uncharacterized repeat protein (TIGR04052 family)
MSMQLARSHRTLFVALTLIACGDDTSPSENDAGGQRQDAAADGGMLRDAATQTDAGRRDAAADASPAPDSATVDESEQQVKLRFRPQLGDQPFACGSHYDLPGERSIALRDFRMFVQDVALIDAEGREVAVKLDMREPWQTADVVLLDFEDGTGECFGTEQTNREITGVVPKGEYRGLRFSHGVPEALNHSDPKDFPAPLRAKGMSWNWLLGLRFVLLEVGVQSNEALDTDAGADPAGFSLHVGSTGCAGNQNAGTIKCSKPNRSRVELDQFELGKSEIVLDVKPLLNGANATQTIECHSGTAVCEPLFQALGVSYATGQPEAGQTVFRLE